jgi:hypothetical protein
MSHHEGHSKSCSSESCHEKSCCSCKNCECGCHSKKHKHCDDLLHLADEAWMEVLKEKIKDEIRQNSADHLKKLAEIVSKANHKRWMDKMEDKRNVESFEEQVRNLMCQQKKCENK